VLATRQALRHNFLLLVDDDFLSNAAQLLIPAVSAPPAPSRWRLGHAGS
jgi:hypothetical protein